MSRLAQNVVEFSKFSGPESKILERLKCVLNTNDLTVNMSILEVDITPLSFAVSISHMA